MDLVAHLISVCKYAREFPASTPMRAHPGTVPAGILIFRGKLLKQLGLSDFADHRAEAAVLMRLSQVEDAAGSFPARNRGDCPLIGLFLSGHGNGKVSRAYLTNSFRESARASRAPFGALAKRLEKARIPAHFTRWLDAARRRVRHARVRALPIYELACRNNNNNSVDTKTRQKPVVLGRNWVV
jgi:hypothetical protein